MDSEYSLNKGLLGFYDTVAVGYKRNRRVMDDAVALFFFLRTVELTFIEMETEIFRFGKGKVSKV